ncbi:MAG: 5'-nucleotidase C-terminal domain-containing protein [Bacteroidia bacterium]|nr:5'-nucleotidase C-terminal domain-containing protein [Bacteroidia bacterium]
MKKNILFLSALLFLLGQCKTPLSLSKTQTQNIKINKDSLQLYDAKIFNTIAPYKIKLDSLMSEVLCYSNQDLKKDLPEGTLGNFVCDELMDFAKINYSKPIDFCMYNNGGLRVGSIAKGNITVGKIYELAPFDNAIVVVELGGNDCKRLFDLIAQNNGTPCSKEFRMTIENNLATNIFINNQPFDSNKTYRILTNDYVASGGDKTEPMKKAIAVTSLNLMVRDALIKQLRTRGNNSQPINTILDGRIK